jgi:hypothetical protein
MPGPAEQQLKLQARTLGREVRQVRLESYLNVSRPLWVEGGRRAAPDVLPLTPERHLLLIGLENAFVCGTTAAAGIDRGDVLEFLWLVGPHYRPGARWRYRAFCWRWRRLDVARAVAEIRTWLRHTWLDYPLDVDTAPSAADCPSLDDPLETWAQWAPFAEPDGLDTLVDAFLHRWGGCDPWAVLRLPYTVIWRQLGNFLCEGDPQKRKPSDPLTPLRGRMMERINAPRMDKRGKGKR